MFFVSFEKPLFFSDIEIMGAFETHIQQIEAVAGFETELSESLTFEQDQSLSEINYDLGNFWANIRDRYPNLDLVLLEDLEALEDLPNSIPDEDDYWSSDEDPFEFLVPSELNAQEHYSDVSDAEYIDPAFLSRLNNQDESNIITISSDSDSD